MPSSLANNDPQPEGQSPQAEPAAPPGNTAPLSDAPPPGGPDDLPPSEAALRDELARADDRYKRALADLDNYRKRSAREVERQVAEAREAQLRDWLQAVDSVERALSMQPGDAGLEAVLEQMDEILARQGVVRLGVVGERFDPQHHEAVGVAPAAELPDGVVVEVARSGFGLGDGRLLRPAQVVVSRRPVG